MEQTDADDTVNATTYNDVIYGNGGHDTISAGAGNDTLIGGIGNDILNGGMGDDAYVYNLGDGYDTISDTGGSDKIKFGSGVSAENLSFEQIGQNLRIYVNGKDSEGLLINNQFGNAENKVESIEFADGSSFDITSADQLVQAMNAFVTTSAALTDFNDPTTNASEMYDLACGYDLIKK